MAADMATGTAFTATQSPHHDDPSHVGRLGQRLVRRPLQRNDAAAPQEPIRRDEVRRLERAQPRGHRGCGVPREDRRVHRLQLPERKDRDHRLEEHRQVDAHAGAGTHALGGEHRGRPVHGFLQLGAREPAHGAVLALPGDRLVRGMRCRQRIHGSRGVVERPAGPPSGERHAAREIQHGRGPALPRQSQVVRCRTPEPCGIRDGPRLQRIEVRQTRPPQELGGAGLGEQRRIGPPGGLRIGSGEGDGLLSAHVRRVSQNGLHERWMRNSDGHRTTRGGLVDCEHQ